MILEIENLAWNKMTGLLPVIIQDNQTLQVLMLGYMNRESLQKTLQSKKVTFFSRSKQREWIKGETSGNFLNLIDIFPDCDGDALLIRVTPNGPCCHLQNASCFGKENPIGIGFLMQLANIISQRQKYFDTNSYTSKLFIHGTKRIAQKVGEEGVEVALAAMSGNSQEIINEAADLIFHLFILLQQCNIQFEQIVDQLHNRNAKLSHE